MKNLKRVISLIIVAVMLIGIIPIMPVEVEAATDGKYIWPVSTSFIITAGWTYPSGGHHGATDFGASLGSPVYATAAGTVVTTQDYGCTGSHQSSAKIKCSAGTSCPAYLSYAADKRAEKLGGWGNWVVIDHGNNVYSLYAHLQTGSFSGLKVGQKVSQGERIASSGTAGNSSGPHLHFEMWMGGNSTKYRVDPQNYLTKTNAPTPTYVDIGTNFYAIILNKPHWKIIENNNGVVQTANEVGKANQVWYFERQSDGSYKISSCQDGTCLDVYNYGSTPGTKVQTCPSNDSTAQRWYFYEQSGGYVMKAKCTDCVLDLPNNDPQNGNQLQMYTRNNTGAQVWEIYRGNENSFKGPELKVSVGNSITETTFTWEDIYGESYYDLKIWKNKLWDGPAYHIANKTNSGYKLILDPGVYYAYVDAVNYFQGEPGNVVEFTINPVYTIAHWFGGFENSEGDNSTNTMKNLGNYTYTATVGSTYSLDTSTALGMPKGFYIEGFGTSSISGSWNHYDLGTTVTQKNGNMGYEYYYYPVEYTIKYNLNGGTNASSNPSTYNVLYGFTLANPTREGYTFAGWTDADGNKVTGINPGKNASFATNATYAEFCNELAGRTTGNQTLTANWVKNNYNNSIAHWVGGFVNGEGYNSSKNMITFGTEWFTVPFGTDLVVDDSYALDYPNGYTSEPYFGTYDSMGDWVIWDLGTKITQGVKEIYIEYYYTPKKYEITYNLNGGTNSDSNPSTYNVLYGFTLANPTREGYSFAEWTDANGNKVTGINPGKNASFATNATYAEFCNELAGRTTGNQTLTANWVADYCTITYDANGGYGAPEAQTVLCGETVTLSNISPKRTGYTFVGWSITQYTDSMFGSDYFPGDSFKVTSDTVLYATWVKGCDNDHFFETTVINPTCTERGYTTYVCIHCDLTYNDDETDATGHKEELVNYLAPTCTDDGYTGDLICTTCNTVFEQGSIIEKLGHSYAVEILKAPTADTNGVYEANCTVCKDYALATLPALNGDSYSIEVTAKPSCEESGLTVYTLKDTTHGEIIIEVITESSGHSYKANVTAPTCTEGGYTEFVCEDCGDSYIGQRTEAIGHSFVDGACTLCGEAAPDIGGEAGLGDLDGDGKVNAKDTNMLKRMFAGVLSLTDAQRAAADLNGDGAINSFDANLLIRIATGA